MHSDWESVRQHAGTSLDNSIVQHFGDSRAEAQAAVCEDVTSPLTQTTLIQISGVDKTVFCQGQFTNDVSLVSDRHSQLSAYCSPKGRMLTCFRHFQCDDNYYLTLPQELAAAILKRLRLFVLRAKAELTASDWLGLGLSGPNAETLLTECLGQSTPTAVDEVLVSGALCTIRVPGPFPRFELYGPAAPILACWQQLRQQARPVGAAAWTLLDIRAGLPSVAEATQDAFVPQMSNLDLVGGVSFHKGCYVGQEIIARMHYLGRLKRRMFRLCLDNIATLPTPGTDLFAPALRGEQSVGQIVSSAPSPAGGSEALAVLIQECLKADLQLADQDGVAISQLALPYAVPDIAA